VSSREIEGKEVLDVWEHGVEDEEIKVRTLEFMILIVCVFSNFCEKK